MFFVLLIVGVLVTVGMVALVFLLGYHLGGEQGRVRVDQIRSESAQAAQQLHALTRAAFVAMADHAQADRDDLRGDR